MRTDLQNLFEVLMNKHTALYATLLPQRGNADSSGICTKVWGPSSEFLENAAATFGFAASDERRLLTFLSVLTTSSTLVTSRAASNLPLQRKTLPISFFEFSKLGAVAGIVIQCLVEEK